MTGQNIEDGKIGKIIGLDPAAPLFHINDPSTRLNNESGKYVECIHTGNWMAIQDHICTNDIFVNGGKQQPGCMDFIGIEDVVCSHLRAVDIMIASIEKPDKLKAKMCSNVANAIKQFCRSDEKIVVNDKKNSQLTNGSGIYLLTTTDKSPFYKE